jgi:hypothetical protein
MERLWGMAAPLPHAIKDVCLSAWLVTVTLGAVPAYAQRVEVAPFAGYRFGGDFFELVTGRAVDADGSPAVGVVIDVPLSDGLHVEGLLTHQDARIVTTNFVGDRQPWSVVVDHWQGGAIQELRAGRARPFFSGLAGLTRFGVPSDHEWRFVAGGGGGVKLLPSRHVGIRVDARLFATFVDVDARAAVCGRSGRCLTAVSVDIVWQAEFTAGLVVKIP